MSRYHAFAHRDALERRYDGPIPPADPALPPGPKPSARARLFERMAAEALRAAARHRSTLGGVQVRRDGRLNCLADSLAYYRNAGIGSRERDAKHSAARSQSRQPTMW